MYLRNTVCLTLEQPLGCGCNSTQSSTHAQVHSSTRGSISTSSTQSSTHAQVPSNTRDYSGTSLLWLHICRLRMDCTTHVQVPVVDPGFPGRGCQPYSWGCQPLLWPFFPKLHGIEKNIYRDWGDIPTAPLGLSMRTTYGKSWAENWMALRKKNQQFFKI